MSLVAAVFTNAGLPLHTVAALIEHLPSASGSAIAAVLAGGIACTAGGFATFFAPIRTTGAAPRSGHPAPPCRTGRLS
jgi:hypothetical protein